jgi:hypothetical protein
LASLAQAQFSTKRFSDAPRQKNFSEMYERFKKVKGSVVFLGKKINGQISHHCTGTFANISGVTSIISARHCLDSDIDANFYATYLNGGKADTINLATLFKEGKSTIFTDPVIDIIVIPIKYKRVVPEGLILTDSMLVTIDYLAELDEVVYVSFQPQLDTPGLMLPIVRKGIISGLDKDGKILMDGFAFKGNSGSLALLAPSIVRSQIEGTFLGYDDKLAYKIVGIIVRVMADYQMAVFDPKTKNNVEIFGNTGLTIIEPASNLRKILERKDVKEYFQKK